MPSNVMKFLSNLTWWHLITCHDMSWCGHPDSERWTPCKNPRWPRVRKSDSYVPSFQQHLIIMWYSCRHCQRIDFVELSTSLCGHPATTGKGWPECWTVVLGPHLARPPSWGRGSLRCGHQCLFVGSNQPWMATVACGKFYKVYSLAVTTRISHYYQVLFLSGAVGWWQ